MYLKWEHGQILGFFWGAMTESAWSIERSVRKVGARHRLGCAKEKATRIFRRLGYSYLSNGDTGSFVLNSGLCMACIGNCIILFGKKTIFTYLEISKMDQHC